jgi:DNA-binding GntR family transcriptional regulator
MAGPGTSLEDEAAPAGFGALRFANTDHSPLSRVIHSGIRDAILNGVLRPGQLLRQEELARRFRVSRAPLREALNMLAAEGLVVLRPRRGFAVTSLDSRELLEILQLRIVIEEHAGYVATLTRTEDDIVRLRDVLEAMDRLPISNPAEDELAEWAKLNRRFHDTLEAASGRRNLCQIASNLRAKIEPYIRLEVVMIKNFGEAQSEHHRLFDAFSAGDAETVSRLSRTHSEHTAVRLISALHQRSYANDLPISRVSDTGGQSSQRTQRKKPQES